MKFEVFRALLGGERSAQIPFWEAWFNKHHLLHRRATERNPYETLVRVSAELGMAGVRIGGVPLNCTFARNLKTVAAGLHQVSGGLSTLAQLESHPLPHWTGLAPMLKQHLHLAHDAGMAGIIYQPWSLQSLLSSMGSEELADKAYQDPEFVSYAIRWVEERNRKAITEVVAEVLPEAVLFDAADCCDANGLLLGRDDLRTLVLPETRATLRLLRELRIPVIFHAGGKVDQLLPLLIELGVNAFHGLDSRYNDLETMVWRHGESILLMGNMNPAFLAHADDEAIRLATRAMLHAGHHRGRFVASCQPGPSDTIPDHNYLVMCQAIRDFSN